ncbi:MAG: hypothetical protein IT244_04295 [Bacteroidia bacterium]|nr:hypothetical protein [Bacteroidia bacterium]
MKYPLLIFTALFVHLCYGQNLKDFKYLKDPYQHESYLGFAGTFTAIRNNAAPFPEAHALQDFSADINYRSVNFDQGEMQYLGHYKLLPDLFFLLGKMINQKNNGLRGEGSSVTSGIAGWHRWVWNVKSKPKMCYSLGFALNDYFMGNSYRDSNNQLKTYEPQGWWLSAGPTAMYHAAIGKHFVFHGTINYNLGYYKPVNVSYAVVDNQYPKPHFFHTHVELVSSLGLFAGIDYTAVINRGNIPGKVRRIDGLLGFKFVM